MEIKEIILQKVKPSCFQFMKEQVKEKAREIWDALNEDNIEINIKTSALGIVVFAVGVGVIVGISEYVSQAELKKALRKQKKELDSKKEEEIQALLAENKEA